MKSVMKFSSTMLLLAGTAAIGFAGAARSEDAKRGGTLRVAISQMAPAADPVVTTFGTNWTTASVVCEGLFAVDKTWTPQPMLADSVAYAEDGLSMTIKLRKGLKFHSGAALTADDVVASLLRFRDAAGIGASFKGIAKAVTAVDPETVRIDLNNKTPIVPALLTITQAVIMSKASLEGASATKATQGLDCTGPYTLKSYQPDQGAVLSRWDGYQARKEESSAEAGAKRAYADEIDLKLMPEASVRRDSLITGDVDYATELPVDFYDTLKGNPDVEPVIVANNQSLTAVFNTKKGPAADVNLRRAIFYALDKDPIMMASVGNPDFYTLDPSWIPDPNSFWYTKAGVTEFAKADAEKAKAYLAKSGYKGEKLRWLVAAEQHTKHYMTAVTAAQQLQAFGINVELVEEPMANYIQDRAVQDKMDVFSSFLPNYIDPTTIAYLNSSYPGFWDQPEKVELMKQLASTLDPKERKAIFEKIHVLAYDAFPFIKYGTESSFYAVRKGTANYPKTAVGGTAFYNVVPPKS